ncbi:titin-like [Mytilus galloprovincialis]|uniref:titin-like n=1 Tax=Mytilus galloprovincialis TaxID=29158 RepID=UPI003F7CACB4
MAMYMSICLFFCLVVIRYNKVTAVSAVQESIIQLKCPYTATADRTIDWNKQINGKTTGYTIGTVINLNLPLDLKSRLTVTGDHTAGDYHLSISDVRKSDEGNYECALSGTSSVSRLQLTVISVPDTPGHFNIRTTSTTSITVVWDSNSGGGHAQTFYIQYRVQGSLSWTTVSAGVEGINEQKRRRTYEVKNLQEGEPYELKMFSENTAGKRSNYTDSIITFTSGTQFIFNMPV